MAYVNLDPFEPLQVTVSGDTLNIRCGSELRHLHDIYCRVEWFICQRGICVHGLPIVLRELLRNAMIHGNRVDPSRIVVCAVKQISETQVQVTIEDEGEGFDYQTLAFEVPDDPRLLRGRGYLLVNAYTNALFFANGGCSVTAVLEAQRVGH